MRVITPAPPPAEFAGLLKSTPEARNAHTANRFLWLLAEMFLAGELSDTRLSALLTHEGIIAPIRAAAGGVLRCDFTKSATLVLNLCWTHFAQQRRLPGGLL